MAYTSMHKYAPVPASKARLVADLVRGKMFDEAVSICKFNRRRAAHFIGKVLKSAAANARDLGEVAPHQLYVSKLRVDGGPTRKKWTPRARGSASPIRNRSSHIFIELEVVSGDNQGED